MPFGIQNHLAVSVFETAEEAINAGHVYRAPVVPVEIRKVVVVRHGTVAGNSTVDLVLGDQQGNEYVVMITGALLKSIPC